MRWWIATCMLLGVVFVGCTRKEGPALSETPETHVVKKPIVNKPTQETVTPTAAEKVLLGSPELLAGIPGQDPLAVADITKWLDELVNHAPLEIELRMWLKPGAGQVKDLKDGPMTRGKIELGRQLFFDKRLSADNTISCASCHEPENGYTVDTPVAIRHQRAEGKTESVNLAGSGHALARSRPAVLGRSVGIGRRCAAPCGV